jgi:hypothetical protein
MFISIPTFIKKQEESASGNARQLILGIRLLVSSSLIFYDYDKNQISTRNPRPNAIRLGAWSPHHHV